MPARIAPRVLVTRAREQGAGLISGLRAIGADPAHLPAIVISDPTSFEALDACLRAVSQFDWLVFTSSNTVERTFRRAEELGVHLVSLSRGAQVAAVGSATAAALRSRLLHPDLVPDTMNAEGLALALRPRLAQPPAQPTRVFLPRAAQAPDLLPALLMTAGATVVTAAAYRNIIPQGSAQTLRTLVGDGDRWPDAVTFTSSSTVTHLLALLHEVKLTLPETVLRFSIGPVTSQTLREHGFPPHAQAEVASTASLIDAIRVRFDL